MNVLRDTIWDVLFGGWRWWRRMRGGTWYHVAIPYIHCERCLTCWTRCSLLNERVIAMEEHP